MPDNVGQTPWRSGWTPQSRPTYPWEASSCQDLQSPPKCGSGLLWLMPSLSQLRPPKEPHRCLATNLPRQSQLPVPRFQALKGNPSHKSVRRVFWAPWAVKFQTGTKSSWKDWSLHQGPWLHHLLLVPMPRWMVPALDSLQPHLLQHVDSKRRGKSKIPQIWGSQSSFEHSSPPTFAGQWRSGWTNDPRNVRRSSPPWDRLGWQVPKMTLLRLPVAPHLHYPDLWHHSCRVLT